jgi:methenyltetrahydromethanopterin cyclohydrolase
MASALLRHYVRLLNWLIRRLLETERLYRNGAKVEQIMEQITERYDVHPELVYLLVTKLDSQGGCLNPMDRLWATVMR